MHRAAARSLAVAIAAASRRCALVARRDSIPRRCSSRRPTAGRPITATTPASATAALTQITPDNVHQLTLAWAFQTGQTAADQGDADSRQRRDLHHDARQPLGDRRAHRRGSSGATPIRTNQGFHIGHRGAAVYKDTVYLTTPDAHLVALDARDGKVKWNVEIADAKTRLLVDQRAAASSAIT